LENRRLTNEERAEWIAEYVAMGGPSAYELEVIRLINEIRADYGLNLLTIDNNLMMAARFYSQIMSNLNTTLGHNQGPYATNPSASHGASEQVAIAFGGRLVWNGGNGAAGLMTPQELVDGWMNSPGHYAYIVHEPHLYIGFGSQLGGQWGVFHYLFLSALPSL